MAGSLARSQGAIGARLGEGLAFLATVGSTAPFIGLFGTVIGIYRALIKIGASGQASIDTVAGPVGEALIMTALGLVVAVPAVLAYNWLIRRNKTITGGSLGLHQRRSRLSRLERRGEAGHGSASPRPSAQTKSAAAPTQRGSEPVRPGLTSTGAQGSPTDRVS